ncbi:MAG TPA: PA14 domain-containing protein, partial [Tepidisphaeraceae bacterium]
MAAVDALEPRRLLASIAAVTPTNGQQTVPLASNITVRFNEPMNAASLTSSTLQLRDAAGNAVAAAVTYNSTTRTATLDPVANLASTSAYYSVNVIGGASGVKNSLNGNLAADFRFSFTTAAPVFNESTAFGGLIEPTAMEFSPDGRIFVAEKRGIIKVFDSLSDTTADIFADLRTNVHNYWDRGLLGLALDPEFTTGKPFVYVLYTADSDIGGSAPKWGTPGADSDPGASNGSSTVSGKLSRLTASGNAMSGPELVLINDWQNQYPSHSIGDLNFGPDGFLYASGGDGASFNAVDYGQVGNPFNDPVNQGGAVRSLDILSGNDPVTLDGTVIRINPATGAPAPGNPFASNSDTNAKRMIAYGLRNPFRFTFRPGTSELWILDTGWSSYEEINRITSGADAIAENFGWPAYEGPVRQSAYDGANLPVLETLYNTPSAHNTPWFSYAHSEKVAPGSAEPTGGSSPTGIAFYKGGTFPEAFDDAMFFADYSRRQIYVMYKGVDGLPDASTRRVFKATTGGAVDLIIGPDGALYYADKNGNRIQRIAYAGAGAVETNGKLSGTVIGTDAPAATNRDKAFDGNLSTFFDASSAGGAWAGLDLNSSRWVRKISFAPRASFAARMIGGKFQASNTADFSSGVADLHTITTAPAQGQLTSVNVNPAGVNYRYVRYLGPDGSFGNIAEMEVHAGEGLRGQYFDNADFTGATVTRTDPTVNFNFGDGAPAAGISADTFSTLWTGKIQAMESGSYNFRVTSDDGIRLWINGQLLVDQFIDQSPTAYTAAINLTGGQLYDIRIDYYENTGGASVQLEWQRPNRAYETVPTGNLFVSGPSSNVAPTASVLTPPGSANWAVGETISFSGSATDPEDGVLPSTSFSWSLVLIHGNEIDPDNTHEHVIRTFSGVSGGSFVAPDHEYPSWIELRMTATDSSGASTTVIRRLDPQTSQITVASSPGGAPLSFSDRSSTSTITRTWIVGGQATLIAPAQFVSGGVTYVFTGWSDGGALTHDIVAPAANTTYTAFYALPALPTAPSELAAAAVSSSQINLTWRDNATDETGYKIERRIAGGGGGAWSEIGQVGANVTEFADTGLAAGTTYEYRLRAFSGAGDSPYSNVVQAATISASQPPAAPSGLVAINVTTTSLRLTWIDNATT